MTRKRQYCPWPPFYWLTLLAIGLALRSFSAPAEVSSPPGDGRPEVILVLGAAGEPEYGTNFLRQMETWQKACTQARAHVVTIGLDSASTNDLDLLQQAIAAEPRNTAAQLWLVLIGHGTFDGKNSWFNLRGPDLSAADFGKWLHDFQRPLVVINTASASGPFINKLSATNRVIITATRSGIEQNFARFGQYFAEALTSPQADVDHDGEISLLEAFLLASRQAGEFYKVHGRIATEHALLDDNGDGMGTPSDWFRGLHAVKKAKDGAAVDGLLAQQFRLVPNPADAGLSATQLTQRDALESTILSYREKKNQVPEDEYYRQLEALLLQLARWYASNSTSNATR